MSVPNKPIPHVNPVMFWLSQFKKSSQPTMVSSLRKALDMLGNNEDPFQFNWLTLKYDDLLFIRARLLENNVSPNSI